MTQSRTVSMSSVPRALPHRNRWSRRHWKLLVSLIVLCSGAAVAALFYFIRTSDAASLAISTAQSNTQLQQRLGEPIRVGWIISGNIQVNPASGSADLAIPVSGPKGSGTVYTEAHKSAGLWHLDQLQFADKASGERMDLLPASSVPSSKSQD